MATVEGQSIWTAETDGQTLLETTVGDLLDTQSIRHAQRDAFVFPEAGLSWTYAELRHRADLLARGLMALGIAPGERVAVLAPNGPEWLLLEYALAKTGAVLVTVNTAYRAQELAYLLTQGQVAALFTAAEWRGTDYLAIIGTIQAPALRHIVVLGAAPPGRIAFDTIIAFADQVSLESLQARQAAIHPGDVAQIQYTSGTTGAPKGVMLTHRGIINNARLMGHRASFDEHSRLLAVMPMFHTAGCVCNVLGMLAAGGALLAMSAFDPAGALSLIMDGRATVMNGVPTLYLRLLAEPGVREGRYRAASTLRIAFMGGHHHPQPPPWPKCATASAPNPWSSWA